MKFFYKGHEVDSTPTFTVGSFFAKATIICPPSNGKPSRNVVFVDRAHFDDEQSADEFGRDLAIGWINARIHEKSNAPR